MVGVAQNDLGLDVGFQLGHVNALHRALCAHRHKNRRLDLAVIRRDQTSSSVRFCVCIL